MTHNRVLITGSTGLAAGVFRAFDADHAVTVVSRSNGYNINNVAEWADQFLDYEILINCAYSSWSQVQVLETFCQLWDTDTKTIVNIGSMVTDYSRTETDRDHEYFPYRLHKRALQDAFSRLVKTSNCNLKLINPGMIDTSMVSHLSGNKMTVDQVAKHVRMLVDNKEIKRLDLWQ